MCLGIGDALKLKLEPESSKPFSFITVSVCKIHHLKDNTNRLIFNVTFSTYNTINVIPSGWSQQSSAVTNRLSHEPLTLWSHTRIKTLVVTQVSTTVIMDTNGVGHFATNKSATRIIEKTG